MLLFILLMTFIAAAAGLVWFLLAHDHGEKEPVVGLWAAAGFGVLGAAMAASLEGLFSATSNLKPGLPYGSILAAAGLVAVIEESCKFVPLAVFIYKKRYFNEHTDGVIYFALAGLGFGLPENLLYTLQFGSRAGLARMLLTPLFHAAATGTVGYFLIKQKLAKRSIFGVALALTAVTGLHALYDFGLTAGNNLFLALALLTTLALSAGLFWLFRRATELDQGEGLSAAGHNAFCRHCGSPNPKRHLFCTQCGSHA